MDTSAEAAAAAAASFSIPTVTPDDLLQFHLHRFGSTFTGLSLCASTNHEYENEDNFEDVDELDLGYYPDGARRTLTDEQIAIFRHSEIQRLLLKQYRDAEAAAEMAMLGESVDPQTAASSKSASSGQSTTMIGPKIPEKVRKQFTANSAKIRNQNRQKHDQENEDWRVSTRRRVRELDEMPKQEDVVLEY